jgi:hypothetical protein
VLLLVISHLSLSVTVSPLLFPFVVFLLNFLVFPLHFPCSVSFAYFYLGFVVVRLLLAE